MVLAACQGTPDPAATRKPLRDFRGIIHCHSKHSHDSKGTYEEILAAAKAAKVDFICMTDHPPKDDAGLSLREGWTGIHDGVLFIQGHELAGKNLLAIGIREPVVGETPKDRIAAVHRQGGLAFVSHPEEVTDWSLYEDADGMEIYNVHATLKRKAKDKAFLLQVARKLKEDPERSFQLLQELDPAVLKRWDEINQKRRFPGIAGNDAHQNVSFFGFQLDPYPRAFNFVTTHVLAEELTQESILNAVRAGRVYVKFELSSRQAPDPARLSWLGLDLAAPATCELEQGLFVGDSVARWTRNGEPVQLEPVEEGVGSYTLRAPGVYRAELRTFGRDPTAGEPWILTNPVFVRPGRP